MLPKHIFTSAWPCRVYEERSATKERNKLFALFIKLNNFIAQMKISNKKKFYSSRKSLEKVLFIIDFGYLSKNFLVHRWY